MSLQFTEREFIPVLLGGDIKTEKSRIAAIRDKWKGGAGK